MSDLAAGILLAIVNGLIITVAVKFFGDRIERRFVEFQASIDREAFEHETRFTKLHEERAEVIAELYRRLVQAETAYRRVFESQDSPLNFQHSNALWKALESSIGTFEYYDENRLYFSDEVIEGMEALNGEYRHLASQLLMHEYLSQQDASQQDTPYTGASLEAWHTINRSLPEIRRRIETEFRKLLGEKTE